MLTETIAKCTATTMMMLMTTMLHKWDLAVEKCQRHFSHFIHMHSVCLVCQIAPLCNTDTYINIYIQLHLHPHTRTRRNVFSLSSLSVSWKQSVPPFTINAAWYIHRFRCKQMKFLVTNFIPNKKPHRFIFAYNAI